jgi:hypothetical protein
MNFITFTHINIVITENPIPKPNASLDVTELPSNIYKFIFCALGELVLLEILLFWIVF